MSFARITSHRPSNYLLLRVFQFISNTFHLASCFLFGCLPDCLLTDRLRCLVECLTLMTMRQIKHAVSVVALVGCIYVGLFINSGVNDSSTFSASERYGYGVAFLLHVWQLSVFIPLPFFLLNFLGVLLLNVFTQRPKLQHPPLLSPFLCFRVVTRGLFPDLVSENVQQNIRTCEKVGLQNYIIEVVSDESIRLKSTQRCREIIVPREYKTRSGSLFKARALQYALEPGIDTLVPGDWIIHLDEETVLTEDAVVGIVNFTFEAQHSFGQGVITYGNGKIINWITTLADSVRVGIDYGSLRFSLGVLHKPVFSWKGSFIVADSEAEKQISYDHGPEASITEDCFFACVAYSKGYSFGFVEGTMFEQSTFNCVDFIRQRQRWTYGILLTALSKKIPLKYKVGPILMSFASCFLPLNLLMFVLGIFWPIPYSAVTAITYSFNMGTVIYLFILGTLKTFGIQRHGIWKSCFLVFASLFCGIVAFFLENVAIVLVFWFPRSSMNNFYIVNKERVLDDFIKA